LQLCLDVYLPVEREAGVLCNSKTYPPPPLATAVLLNCEPVSEDDPTLLPIPNHVMLNHLYALSISDGVMVMGATSRFNQVRAQRCSNASFYCSYTFYVQSFRFEIWLMLPTQRCRNMSRRYCTGQSSTNEGAGRRLIELTCRAYMYPWQYRHRAR
jgi:hypothetical protein